MRDPAEAGSARGRHRKEAQQRRTALLLGMLRQMAVRQPRDTAGLAAWSLVQALPALVLGWVIARATEDFLARPADALSGLAWLGVLAAAVLASAVASRQTYLKVAALVEPVRDDLVSMVVTGALRAAVGDPDRPDTRAVARITHQAEIVRDCLAGLLAVGLTFAFTALSALAGLGTLVPAVLPFTVVPLATSLALFWCLLPRLARLQRRSVLAEEAVADSAGAALAGLRDVIACGAQDQVRAELAGRVSGQAAALQGLAWLNMLRMGCLAVGGWLPLILVLTDAPSLVRHGVGAGQIIGSVAYIGGVLQTALYTLGRGVGGSGIRLAITVQRIIEASGAMPGQPARGEQGPPHLPPPAAPARRPGDGRVMMRGVSFAYGPHAEPVLRDVDLDIPDGQYIAIAGPSGIGKSTLAGVLAGMLQPKAGQVWLAGRPLSEVPAAELPKYRVLIPQQAYVFAGTLRENLAYLAPAVRLADVAASAEAVGLEPLVARVGGYGAEVSPAALSAGERQLIALARAHLSPAKLAILDEATCHLDAVAAERVERAFADRPGTLIVIAHRMSSALRADRVLVLDGTRLEFGEHEALLASCSLYRDLVGEWHGTVLASPA
ncbi:MAG TPA: ABC transporter ATP-binding protein [Streptosporangiaceae bacterium]|nr:ABC transporter ATP-binding protein [Streptosporangiaceae bacterium]